jgi:hypothetical protein
VSRDDWTGLAAIAIVAIGTVLIAQFAPGAEPAAGAPPEVSEPAEAVCTEWTDGCIVCRRVDGEPMCSTPGIACVRGAMQCLER